MNSDVQLPSNKKFGFFFTFVFSILFFYFYTGNLWHWAFIFIAIAATFFFITLIKADILLPLNKIWMRFGLLLGLIFSPIILAIIFFGLFTPLAFIFRLTKRDELGLKFKTKSSYWIFRTDPVQSNNFKNQF